MKVEWKDISTCPVNVEVLFYIGKSEDGKDMFVSGSDSDDGFFTSGGDYIREHNIVGRDSSRFPVIKPTHWCRKMEPPKALHVIKADAAYPDALCEELLEEFDYRSEGGMRQVWDILDILKANNLLNITD